MLGRSLRGRAAKVLLTLVTLGLATPSPTLCQTPSDLDTMRILNTGALPGDTVAVQFYLRNVIVVGGYNFRLRYDPSLVEPLTDTSIYATDTIIRIEAEQLRGNGFEVFDGGVGSPGILTFVAVDYDLSTGTIFLPGRGVALRMRWRVLPGASAASTTIEFENDPVWPQIFNTMSDIEGNNYRRPVLVPGLFKILACACRSQGDVNNNGISYELGDIIPLISYAFENAPAPPKDASCRHANRGEITCDGIVDVMDVVRMINVLAGRSAPNCDPCACFAYPAVCP